MYKLHGRVAENKNMANFQVTTAAVVSCCLSMEVEAETMSISVASESFVWKVLTALKSNLFFSNGDVCIYIYTRL